ncbi:unnamed protein product [Protopolystoma xenopodis]|uniref:Uncharacterized protein n=1 Tax=Protopolystoma xenopodis TaxID=117903 RepID=A0A3S5CVJ5_9PLAT|nr:unnamed protein product [Protopolystoma xenopodis]
MAYAFWANPHPFCGFPRSLILATNGGGAVPIDATSSDPSHLQSSSDLGDGDPALCLRHVADAAWRLFANRAYLHQYERYGLTKETVMDCFAVVEQTAHCYDRLSFS